MAESKTTGNMVRDEVERELDAISPLSVGDEFIGGAIEDVSTMGRLLIEMERADAEIVDKEQRLKFEQAKFESEMAEKLRRLELEEEKFKYEVSKDNEQKKVQWIKIGLEVFTGAVSPFICLVVYNKWINKGFTFEKEGVLVSQTFRNVFGKFRSPLKK